MAAARSDRLTVGKGRFHLDQIGKWTDEAAFFVTPERIRQYAAATNDDLPDHVTGDIAPPIFAVVPIWDVLSGNSAAISEDDIRLRAVHGDQDIRFYQPIRPGMELRSRCALLGVQAKESGTVVIQKTETRLINGDLVNEQYVTGFYRSVRIDRSRGETPPARMADRTSVSPISSIPQEIDKDQTYRYADASNDRNPFHIDNDIARSLGFPCVIVHGLCSMAFASRAVVRTTCNGDSTRLKRLAVRFSGVILPGQRITTRIWEAGAEDDLARFQFETTNDDGALVMRDGLAVVARKRETEITP